MQVFTVSFNRLVFNKILRSGYTDSLQNQGFCTVFHPLLQRCYNTFSRLRDIVTVKDVVVEN